MVGSAAGGLQPTPLNAIPLSVGAVVAAPSAPAGAASPAVSHPSAGFSFSSNYNSLSAASGSSEEGTHEGAHAGEPRKRMRGGRDGGGQVGAGGGGGRRKMVAFFEGLMRQVVERQEAMQQRLLDTIEKREQDRMVREEAWRRQEAARVTREHEAMAQEREIAAARDATIIAFLQKVTSTGQTAPMPPMILSGAVAAQPLSSQLQRAPPPGGHQQPQAHQQPPPQSNHRRGNEVIGWPRTVASAQQASVGPSTEEQDEAAGAGGGGAADPAASSRWPKSEVLALIKLRSGMETKYQDSGAKGRLWEEVAAGMRRMGYGGRSAKRCKEKWENINKYFKKVKDSSRKRPEDAKTCPYFHELDALYRRKVLILSGAGAGAGLGNVVDAMQLESEVISPRPPAAPASQLAVVMSHGDGGHMHNGGGSSKPDGDGAGALTEQERHRNGDGAGDEGVSSVDETGKEPEDAMRGPADRRRRQHWATSDADHDKMEETESDSMDLQEEEEEEGEKKKTEMEYRVEYHRRPAGGAGAGAAASNGAASGNPFMAMVQ